MTTLKCFTRRRQKQFLCRSTRPTDTPQDGEQADSQAGNCTWHYPFERNTRNLRITDEGRAIAEKARVALAVLDEMKELSRGDSEELSGNIRLTAPAPFGRKYVAPAIAAFCQVHPRVSFDLRLSDQIQDLYSGDFDLAIRMGDLADSRLLARKIANNRRILIASSEYLKNHPPIERPEDLLNHNCLVFAYPGFYTIHGLYVKPVMKEASALLATLSVTTEMYCMPGVWRGLAYLFEKLGIFMMN